jgi:hypothetical protein
MHLAVQNHAGCIEDNLVVDNDPMMAYYNEGRNKTVREFILINQKTHKSYSHCWQNRAPEVDVCEVTSPLQGGHSQRSQDLRSVCGASMRLVLRPITSLGCNTNGLKACGTVMLIENVRLESGLDWHQD